MINLLILFVLTKRELTMYKISKYIKDYFRAFITPSFGSIKPALKNLEEKGFVESRKSLSEGGKQYGYYSITQAGREELKKQILSPIPKNPVLPFSMTSYSIWSLETPS